MCTQHRSVKYCRSETRQQFRRRRNSESLGDFRYELTAYLVLSLDATPKISG